MELETKYNALRKFFVLHFVIDVVSAIPLFLSPKLLLTTLGWQVVDPVAARMVAAALFGIGIESYIGRNSSRDSLIGMLNLKIIWSFSAIMGIGISMMQNIQQNPSALKIIFITFIAFNLLWFYWRIRLSSLEK